MCILAPLRLAKVRLRTYYCSGTGTLWKSLNLSVTELLPQYNTREIVSLAGSFDNKYTRLYWGVDLLAKSGPFLIIVTTTSTCTAVYHELGPSLLFFALVYQVLLPVVQVLLVYSTRSTLERRLFNTLAYLSVRSQKTLNKR
jgi:hypothetical protein